MGNFEHVIVGWEQALKLTILRTADIGRSHHYHQKTAAAIKNRQFLVLFSPL